MKVYHTEEEQINALRMWWENNHVTIIIVVVFGIGIGMGVWGWRSYQASYTEETATAYHHLLQHVGTIDDTFITTEQREELDRMAQQLQDDYPKSTYAHFAAMIRAKYALLDDDIEATEEYLRWTIDNCTHQQIKPMAQLRLARLLSDQQRYDEALQLINGAQDNPYQSLFTEVRGDIYWQQEEPAEALQAYQSALALLKKDTDEDQRPLLRMKINDLSSRMGVSPEITTNTQLIGNK